jgi:putative methyltransferase (TIGR04325 family)
VFGSWPGAGRSANRHDAKEIIQKVRTATLKVVRGEAACELDSVLFAKPAFPFPLIVVRLRGAQKNQGSLTVLDYGGALGSSYFQCREFLYGLKTLRRYVEQPKFVACGQREFLNEIL